MDWRGLVEQCSTKVIWIRDVQALRNGHILTYDGRSSHDVQFHEMNAWVKQEKNGVQIFYWPKLMVW